MERLNYSDAWDYFAGTYTDMIEDCTPKTSLSKGRIANTSPGKQ